nr:CHAT domain-containing protein [uncultured Carboxylicivirga sp.]
MKKKYLNIVILQIINMMHCCFLVGQNKDIVTKDNIISNYYQNHYQKVIDLGSNYLLNNNAKNNVDELIVLSHVFKSYAKTDDLTDAFELIKSLREKSNSWEFEKYTSFYEACIYVVNNQTEIALPIFEKLLKLDNGIPLPDSIQAKLYHNLAICYKNIDRKRQLSYYQKSYALSKKLLKSNRDYLGYNMSLSSYLNAISTVYKRYEEAYGLYQEILNEDFNKEVLQYNENLYLNYLRFCTDMGLESEFERIADMLEKFYRTNIDAYRFDLGVLYNRRGMFSKNRGKYTEAINYYQKALSVTESAVNYRNFRSESTIQLARIYRDIGNENLSVNYAKQTVHEAKLKKSKNLYLFYSQVANLYAGLHKTEIAYAYLDSASNLAVSKQQFFTSKTFNNLSAWAYLRLKNYQKSLDFFKQVENILNQDNNFGDFEYWDNTNDMALAYLGLHNYLRVTEDLSRVYQEINNRFKSELQSNNTSRVSSLFKRVNLNLAKAYYGLFEETDNNDYLQKSLEHLEQADQSIDAIRSQLNFDTDRVVMGDLYSDYISLAVKINLGLFHNTGKDFYLKKSFEFAQKGKSYSLLLGLNDKQIKIKAGIPDSLIQKENHYKGRFSFYQNEFDQLKLSNNPNEDDLEYLMKNRDKYLKSIDSLMSIIAKDYPRYYQLKYQPQLTTIKEVQEKLGEQQVLVDYFLLDNRLIQFVISKTSFRCNEVQIGELFYDDLNFVLKEISTPFRGSGDSVERLKKFSKASYHLYSQLLGTIESDIKGKELIIIPHAELSYLSFESLLTEDVSKDKPDMRQYPWLIKEYSVNYEYNAAILSSFRNGKREFNKVYSFAPEYFGDESTKDSVLVNIREAINDYLMPLPSAKEEIEKIGNIFDSEIFEGRAASKANFLDNAISNNVMHLAMHSLNDELMPLNSQLVFSAESDSNDVLKAYELYNYDLNAPMVVLSSCSTGRGKRQNGEGLISLARAFKFSGVETQVFTLWPVDDQSGAILTELFYTHLKAKEYKDEALRQAKLDFIKNADAIKAHPYYWANYVITGNTCPIQQKTNSYYWFYLLILPIALLVTIKLRRKNTN